MREFGKPRADGVEPSSASSTAPRPSGRPRAPLPHCQDLVFHKDAGKVGLTNLGNSCFMNAGLQCLCHIPPLASYFVTGRYKEDVNKDNFMGHGGHFAAAFAELVDALWFGGDASKRSGKAPKTLPKTFSPKALHTKMGDLAPHLFGAGEMQDAQEFLAFCLDGLHEDLNRVKSKPRPRTEEEELEDVRFALERGAEAAAALSWARYLERGRSYFVDLLQGQLQSSLTCSACGYSTCKYDPFLYLSLPVTAKFTKVTDAIGAYLEEEVLQGENAWCCPKCEKKVTARKKIDLWKLPPYLVLHLKRFEYNPAKRRFEKLSNSLEIPPQLDLDGFTSSSQRDGACYQVISVANHSGTMSSGHYTATCKVNGTWCRFNDSKVTELRKGESVVGPEAYVIFLARCKASVDKLAVPTTSSRGGGAPTVLRQSLSDPRSWPHRLSSRPTAMEGIFGALGEVKAAVAEAAGRGAAADADAPARGALLEPPREAREDDPDAHGAAPRPDPDAHGAAPRPSRVSGLSLGSGLDPDDAVVAARGCSRWCAGLFG